MVFKRTLNHQSDALVVLDSNGNQVFLEADPSTKRLKVEATAGSTPVGQGLVSTVNSSTLALSSTQTYTGTFEDVSQYASVSVLVIIDTGSSEAATLTMELSTDAVGTHTRSKSVEVSFGNSSVHTLSLVSNYFRVSLAADQGTAATGYIQTIYNVNRTQGLMSFIGESINDQNDCSLVRSVLTAKNTLDTYENVRSDVYGKLEVSLPQAPYGELVTVPDTPLFNGLYLYDVINTQKFTTFLSNGTASVSDSLLSLDIDTTAPTADVQTYALIRSRDNLQYFPGTSNMMRFTALFNTPVALSLQRVGLGTAGNEVSLGYNGTTFSTYRGYGGKQQEELVTVTASSTIADTYDVVLNGITYSISLTNGGGDDDFTANEIALTLMASSDDRMPSQPFTNLWHAQSINSTVILTAVGVGARAGTYSFTAQATGDCTVSFAQTTLGVALTDEWNSSFNVNQTLIDSLDFTKGNVFEIEFSWLGFNTIRYKVIDPTTNEMEVFHELAYPNLYTTPSVLVPHLPFQCFVASAGSTTAMSIKTASVGLFTRTELPKVIKPRFAEDNTKNVASGATGAVLLGLRVRYSMNGIVFQSQVLIDKLSISTEAAKSTVFKIILNPTDYGAGTTSDYADWQYEDSNDSAILVDTNALTYSGGTILDEFLLAGGTSLRESFGYRDITLQRDDLLLIHGSFPSGGAADLSCSISWVFDL
jgi:hypothetical protein